MTRFLIRSAAAVLLIAATAAASLPAVAHEDTPGQLHISVRGSASAVPDIAHLSAGVVAEARTAAEAMAGQRERMNRVMDAIRKAGIGDRDIQTSGISLSPVYSRDPEHRSAPRIDGYRAVNRVNVTVRDLKKVGAGLDALVSAGANDIGHVSFGFSDQESIVEAARADAMKRLKARRDFYAEAGGITIGRLMNLSEGGGIHPPRPMMAMDRAESLKAAPTPVAPGEAELGVTLNAVYQILD